MSNSYRTSTPQRTKFIRSTRRLGQLFTGGASTPATTTTTTTQLFRPAPENRLSRRSTISGFPSSTASDSNSSSLSSFSRPIPLRSRSRSPPHLTIDLSARHSSSSFPPQPSPSPSTSTATATPPPSPTPIPNSAAARKLKMDRLARTLGETPPAELVFPSPVPAPAPAPPRSHMPPLSKIAAHPRSHTPPPLASSIALARARTPTPLLAEVQLPQTGQAWSAPWEHIDPETWARARGRTTTMTHTQHRDQPPSPTSTTHSREALLKKRLPMSSSPSSSGTAGRTFWRGAGGTFRGRSSSEDSLTSLPPHAAQSHLHSGLSVVRIASNDSAVSSLRGSRSGSEKSGIGVAGGGSAVAGYSGRVHVRELKYPSRGAIETGVGGVTENANGSDGAPEPTPRVNLRRATRMAHIFGHPSHVHDGGRADSDTASIRSRLNKVELDARGVAGLAYMLDHDLDTLFELLSLSADGAATDDDDGDPEWPYEDEVKRLSVKPGRMEKGKGKELDAETQKPRQRLKQSSTPALTPLCTYPTARSASLPLPTPPPTSRSLPRTPSPHPPVNKSLPSPPPGGELRAYTEPTYTSTSLTPPPSSPQHATAPSTTPDSPTHSLTPLVTLQRRRAARLERVFRVSYRELFEYMVVFEGDKARVGAGVRAGAGAGAGKSPGKAAGDDGAGAGEGGRGGKDMQAQTQKSTSVTGEGPREGPAGKAAAPVSMMTLAAVAKVAAMAAGAGTTHQGYAHERVARQEPRRDRRPHTGGGEATRLPILPTHALTSVPALAASANSTASKARSAMHRRSASLDLLTQMHVHGPGSGGGGGSSGARETQSGSTSTSTLASSSSSSSISTPADGTPQPLTTTPAAAAAHSHAKAYSMTAAYQHHAQAADASQHAPTISTTTTTTTITPQHQHQHQLKPLFLHSPLAGSFRDTVVPPSPPPFAGYPAKEQPLGIGYGYEQGGYENALAAGKEEGGGGGVGVGEKVEVGGLAAGGGAATAGGGRTTPTLAQQKQHPPSTTTAVHVQRKGVITRVVSVSRGRAGGRGVGVDGSVELRRRAAEDMQGVMNRLRELK